MNPRSHLGGLLEDDLVVVLGDDGLASLDDSRGGLALPGAGGTGADGAGLVAGGVVEELEDVVEGDGALVDVVEVDLDLHLELAPARLADLK